MSWGHPQLLFALGYDVRCELLCPKHLHIVDERDHGVLVEVSSGDMLQNVLGDFGSGDDFNLCIAGFGVAWAHAALPFAMHPVAGVTSSAKSEDFLQEAIFDSAIADDDNTLHDHRVHVGIPLSLLNFMFLDLVVEQTTVNLKMVGRFRFVASGFAERASKEAFFELGDGFVKG